MANFLFAGLSGVVAWIRPPSNGTNDSPVEITNLKALGSYNWVEDRTLTIAVPGRPPVWKEQHIPIHLKEDLGTPFFDEGIARKCGHALGPALLAIEVCQATDPNFKLSNEKIDIVSNRNNLRSLIDFANTGVSSSRTPYARHFRIDAQLAPNGRTMVLTRYETKAPSRQKFIGFDHIFERTCTEELPSIRTTNSAGRNIDLQPLGYYRIVRYDLLGMRFLVRSRVDSMKPESKPNSTRDPDIDGLSKALGETNLEPRSATLGTLLQGEGTDVQHVDFGEFVPQDLLMDLKLSPRRDFNWNNVYPQYFLSQTPNLKIATRSTAQHKIMVTRIDTYGEDILKTDHTKQFQRFIALLTEMRRTLQVHGSSSQPLAFVQSQEGVMKVFKIRQKGKYLSDEGLEKF